VFLILIICRKSQRSIHIKTNNFFKNILIKTILNRGDARMLVEILNKWDELAAMRDYMIGFSSSIHSEREEKRKTLL